MRQTEPDASTALRQLAEAFLKRPLTAEEEHELETFQRSNARTPAADGSTAASGDPAEHARAQAAQAVNEGRMRADSAIRDILHNIQGTTTQALRAYEHEEQAILKVVQAARTLADLRPSVLGAERNTPAGGRMALSQIADRLANLVKTEVEQNFQQTFGRLQQQMESAIGELHAARQAPQQESAAVDTPRAAVQPSNPEPQGA